ncbi:MAG: 16S rRNA (guanine(527)-N(7))-methyltransferase RsmG [Clostridia bacterium]|nr:16S rRNA (guanine(527)-N(7))-methyltransferase RsmG [Clostridia bacterium]
MNQTLLIQGIAALGGSLSDTQLSQFAAYSALLKEWNQKMNLTAITDDDGISVKHFLDSILPLYHIQIPPNASLADIGTGAGFPGVPLKIIRPDLSVTLVDSLNKRITFLEAVCRELGLTNVTCIHGRAEELGKDNKYREKFDLVTSRAVANLRVLGEYCLPLTKVGGQFLALKADGVDEELSDARPMLGTLGGGKPQVIPVPLPESDMVRKLVLIPKEKPTPSQFPRRANKIK